MIIILPTYEPKFTSFSKYFRVPRRNKFGHLILSNFIRHTIVGY